jgi:hypothetical protein
MVLLVASAMAPATSRAVSAIFGSCLINIAPNKNITTTQTKGNALIIKYKFPSSKINKQARATLSCIDKNFEDALMSEYEKNSDEWTFLTGAQGSIHTKSITGNGWHGLVSDYYLGSQCFFLIGDIGDGHTISINQCDKEADLATEKKSSSMC